MRAFVAVILLLAPALAGCASPQEPASATPFLVALDGRYAFPLDGGLRVVTRALGEPPTAAGAARFVDARVLTDDGTAVATARVAAFTLDAFAALGVDPVDTTRGIVVTPAFAARAGVAAGDRVTLAAEAWPTPEATTGFEMERVVPCDGAPPGTRFCARTAGSGEETRLIVTIPEGAYDIAFRADVLELTPDDTPAWWNGSFTTPTGERLPFQAHAPSVYGPFVDDIFPGPAAPGEWQVEFTLDANGRRVAAGAAGRVSVREAGYTWFDDELLLLKDAGAQAEVIRSAARPTSAPVTVAAVAPAPHAFLGDIDVFVPFDVGGTLAGDRTGFASALIVAHALPANSAEGVFRDVFSPAALAETQPDLLALGAYDLPVRVAAPPSPSRVLAFHAPVNVDASALPSVAGAEAPVTVLATRGPVAGRILANGAPLANLTFYAPGADAAATPPWRLAEGARYANVSHAIATLAASAVVTLPSDDLGVRGTLALTGRGDPVTRVVGASVTGGPSRVVWLAAAAMPQIAAPVGVHVLAAVSDGEDAAAVQTRLNAAWAPLGLAPVR